MVPLKFGLLTGKVIENFLDFVVILIVIVIIIVWQDCGLNPQAGTYCKSLLLPRHTSDLIIFMLMISC